MPVSEKRVSDTIAILHWVQFKGTPQQISGEDVFVTKNGKITMQWLGPGTPDAAKAPGQKKLVPE